MPPPAAGRCCGEVLLLGKGVSRRRECPCVSSTHQRALMWRAESMPSLLLPMLLLRILLAGCNSRTFPSAVPKTDFSEISHDTRLPRAAG